MSVDVYVYDDVGDDKGVDANVGVCVCVLM